MTVSILFPERSRTLVAGIFDNARAARYAFELVSGYVGADLSMSLLGPCTSNVDRCLEPESDRIASALLRAHLLLVPCGLFVGALVALLIVRAWPAASTAPGYVLLVASVFGAMLGGLAAGLVVLRIDHAAVIDDVQEALAQGDYVVVARPLHAARARAEVSILQSCGARTTLRSL